MEVGETRYVAVGDADVAYRVVGDGPRDVLYFYGLGSHFEQFLEMPLYAAFLTRLTSFSRVILFDRRGTGGSDAVPLHAIPTWEEWTEDVRAVLGAVESRQAAIFAAADAGPIAILLAAMHPELVSALVLFNTTARYMVADDYPAGMSPDVADLIVEGVRATWGTPDAIRAANPGMSANAEFVSDLARQFRSAATPHTAAAQYEYILHSLDVREALPLIQVPTLIIHVRDCPLTPIEHGRYLGGHIAGATLVELPGADFAVISNGDAVADEVAEFLTGESPPVAIERILTTVLFTDIVGSTQQAAVLGDQRWRALLDTHDRVVRDKLRRFRGREINTTGDGFVAAFDGPAQCIRCATAILEAVEKKGIKLRAGLHTGECEVRGDDLGGLAVHIAARVGAMAAPGEVLVSGTVTDLVVGSGIEFSERGEHQLKGVPGTWKLFAVKP